MKLEDLATIDRNANAGTNASPDADPSYGAKRNAAHPEIAELLKARTANALLGCRGLARDETELANFIISKLDADHHYVPSETVMQAIRNLCDRISGQASFAGMIRTG